MNPISYEQLLENIENLFDCEAFEMQTDFDKDGIQNTLIPYMMNDALECYILLKNSRITGQFLKDYKGETTIEFLYPESGPALIFHQGIENVFTIWFENCYQIQNLYRYDQIGHFWVKGEEHWRRLVYIIGTIYDKYAYMGESSCTKEELELLPLMGFASFRFYSPVKESLDAYYENTPEGLNTMISLAQEAKDWNYLKHLKLYHKFPNRLLEKHLTKLLNLPERLPLYELILGKIQQAASIYPVRNYGIEMNRQIEHIRQDVAHTLKTHGFEGTYPLFHKDNLQIYAVEEHPFTILDWEHFSFRIQYMVSEGIAAGQGLHYGFFKKAGNTGRIETTLDFLKQES